MRYLGLDMGTTTITALVLDVDKGEVVTVQSVANGCEVTLEEDKRRGRSEWDAEGMFVLALEVMQRAVEVGGSVDGVGVTGQMHGMLLVNGAGDSVGPFVGWQDRRGMDALEETTVVGRMQEIAKESGVFERGCRPHPGYLGTTLFWLAQEGRLSGDVMASFLPDWIVAQLTGTRPVTDATNAAGSGLYDTVEGIWRRDLIEELGLSVDRLPKVMTSGKQAGGLVGHVVDKTGLVEGLPVCVSCGDNQASFAGSVGDYAKSLLVNVGTGGQVSAYVPQVSGTAELEARPFMDGGFLLVGAGLVGGRSYAWLRNFFRGIGQAFYGGQGDEDLYEAMNRLAAEVPKGSDGLLCEPLFTGTRREPDRRGIWSDVGTANFTPGHMARALLEGLTEQFATLYGEMEHKGVGGRTTLVGAGNGIRKNALLREILEDRFGMTMRIPAHTEEAAFGAGLMSAVSNGVFGDVKEAGRVIQYIR